MFGEKQIEAAIARLSTLSSKEIRELQARARERNLERLADECAAELAKRPFDYSAAEAMSHARMAQEVADFDLEQAILHAFSAVRPASPDEVRIIQWIAQNPGGTFRDAIKAYGKGDLSLAIGHLVYDRYGCFLRYVEQVKEQSSVLIRRQEGPDGVRYWLKPEAEDVFRKLGLIS